MKLITYKIRLFIYILYAVQFGLLTSCHTKSYNTNNQSDKIGFLSFYLDMDNLRVKIMIDSMLARKELHYFETTDILGKKQTNLYYDFTRISPSLCALVNLRGSYIIDQRLTSIQLTLCNRSDKGEQTFSYNCDLKELEILFEQYKERYGRPTILGSGDKYNWLSKKISGVYLPGTKGRLAKDRIYFWVKGNYIIYFDFGLPGSQTRSDNVNTESKTPELVNWTIAPIIYYDFTQDYIDELLDKASRMKKEEFK